jgi:signal transduction histidine kinase
MAHAFRHPPSDSSLGASHAAAAPEEPRATAASYLAHDARNWLTVLQVYCDLLRSSDAVVGKGRMWIEELSHAVERGQGLVMSLLDSAEASAAQPSTPPLAAQEKKPLNLGEALQRRLPLFQKMAGSRIQVEARIATQTGTTALQETELDRVLLNLVRNAIDAMPQGGRLTIELEPGDSSHRRSLVLRVSDTGEGIPADILTHIFDSGFSTKPTSCDPHPERGFGLAIVRELTLGAGGSVRVRSRIGHGTCFTIELPLLSRAGVEHPHTPASQPGKLTAVTEMPKPKPGGTAQPNNFDAHQKGTRVPC